MGLVTNGANTMQSCIDACSRCTQACYECFKACLNEPNLNDRKNCVCLLVECFMMCEMAVAAMSMDSQFAKDHCRLCAQICDKCAQECAAFKDDHCQKCAAICRTCADECKKMAAMR